MTKILLFKVYQKLYSHFAHIFIANIYKEVLKVLCLMEHQSSCVI